MVKKIALVVATVVTALTWPGSGNAAEPVKLGVALSQTGNLADSAAPYFKGLDLWREQANARGGLAGRPVEFVMYDDRSDPATAARRELLLPVVVGNALAGRFERGFLRPYRS